VGLIAMSLDLPMGFDDAPETVQIVVLQSKPATKLAEAIREEVESCPEREYESPQLNKEEMAHVIVRLQLAREAINQYDGE